MYNKKITFGKSEAYLADYETKQKIIDYLYSKVELLKFRYIMLNNIQKLKFLQENDHYVSPNFKGYNYLLIMITLNNKQYCAAIDRKKLSYHKNQLDMKTIQIILLNIKTTESIYVGSIFDGKLIQTSNDYIYLIQDCFYLSGVSILETEMTQKMTQLDTTLKNNFKKDKSPYCNNFEFKLNKLYNYSELEDLIKNISKLPFITNGIIFYPKFSGVNVLHIENKVDKVDKVDINSKNTEIIEQKSYHIIHGFVDFLKSRTYSYEQNGKTNVFWLNRTMIPDVYDLAEKENGDKLGIALIPNLKISQMCDDIITNKSVKFNCIFSTKFKKWIPLTVVT